MQNLPTPGASDDHAAPPVPLMPQRAADIPHAATFRNLVLAFEAHNWALLTSRHDGPVLPPAEFAARSLAVLVLGHVLRERLRLGQWLTVRDALIHGATVQQVAEAMALDVDEVTFGLRSWADGQLAHGLISGDDHAAALALVAPGRA